MTFQSSARILLTRLHLASMFYSRIGFNIVYTSKEHSYIAGLDRQL